MAWVRPTAIWAMADVGVSHRAAVTDVLAGGGPVRRRPRSPGRRWPARPGTGGQPAAARHGMLCADELASRPAVTVSAGSPAEARAWLISASTCAAAVSSDPEAGGLDWVAVGLAAEDGGAVRGAPDIGVPAPVPPAPPVPPTGAVRVRRWPAWGLADTDIPARPGACGRRHAAAAPSPRQARRRRPGCPRAGGACTRRPAAGRPRPAVAAGRCRRAGGEHPRAR